MLINIKQDIEKLYDGRMDVYEMQPVVKDHKRVPAWVKVHENVPCRKSYSKKMQNTQTGYALEVQETVINCSPEINIKPGSKLKVTQAGDTTEYSLSGKPAVYFSHQEIQVELFEERA